MGPSGKWIDGIQPDASVAEAARVSLSARLTAVAHWLPLAAHHAAQDVEHVHRLRVSTRRAVAALRLYRDWLRPKHDRWIRKRLKRVRRAAGEARDLDVFADRLRREMGDKALLVLSLMQAQRAAAQPAIVATAEKCRRNDRFLRKVDKLLKSIDSPGGKEGNGKPIVFRDWAREQLSAATGDFFADVPLGSRDAAALHQFRIRGKAVRYTIELVSAAFGPELRNDYYPIVEELQERLGAVNDRLTAARRLGEWRDEDRAAADGANGALYDQLIAHEEAEAGRLIGEFHEWWTPGRTEALRAGLSPGAAEGVSGGDVQKSGTGGASGTQVSA